MRAIVVGGVRSTAIVLDALLRHDFDVAGVLGYEPRAGAVVSSWSDLEAQASAAQVAYQPFRSVNSAESVAFIAARAPDVIFAVGLSQLVSPQVLDIPRLGTIGFHPTRLPMGRGRAPMAWLVETGTAGAASFFEVTPGVDEGRIFVQEPFAVYDDDHAEDAYRRLHTAMRRALDRWLPELREGGWDPTPQPDHGVSIWGKRTPSDGLIDWSKPAREVDALIRAAAAPHPGAYTFVGDVKVYVPRSRGTYPGETLAFPGSVLGSEADGSFLVQAGDRALRVELICDAPGLVRVGTRLGYAVEHEVHALRKRVANLEQTLERLLGGMDSGPHQ